MTLLNPLIEYKIKPKYFKESREKLLHDTGQLYFEVIDLDMQADGYHIRVNGERQYEIKPAFGALLNSYLDPEQPLSQQQMRNIEKFINERIIEYS